MKSDGRAKGHKPERRFCEFLNHTDSRDNIDKSICIRYRTMVHNYLNMVDVLTVREYYNT